MKTRKPYFAREMADGQWAVYVRKVVDGRRTNVHLWYCSSETEAKFDAFFLNDRYLSGAADCPELERTNQDYEAALDNMSGDRICGGGYE